MGPSVLKQIAPHQMIFIRTFTIKNNKDSVYRRATLRSVFLRLAFACFEHVFLYISIQAVVPEDYLRILEEERLAEKMVFNSAGSMLLTKHCV